MTIQAISPVIFNGQKKTEKGNTYNSTSLGTVIGVTSGVALAASLMHFQTRALKSIRGKRNLISGYHDRGLSLNDAYERVIKRDESGKIIPPKNGKTDRTRKIIKEFRTNLALWGAAIIALTTGTGRVIDSSINETKAKRADAKISKV